ncbi:MAG TPA: DUF86 domain-containing protein [Phycisphaerales bacterium]|nr:DUF86 domain-containing protein [Phycisphaerales bacterium]
MSKTEDLTRLRHMLDAARKALEFTRNCDRADLDRDEKLALSVVRLLEILGEAAKTVSEQCRERHPEIPWRQIGAARNRLIHGYFDVDLDVVWNIVSADLPVLLARLERILSGE